MRTSSAPIARIVAPAFLLTASMCQADGPCETLVFTNATDFSNEFWINLNNLDDQGTPAGQLRVNMRPVPLPYITVAVSGVWAGSQSRVGTLVRIDTEGGNILGEYLTAPVAGQAPEYGRNPSRTTTDLYGNIWSANRDEGAIAPAPPTLVEFGSIV